MNRFRVSCAALVVALTLLALAGPVDLLAQQGVTTGAIAGQIVDNAGAPLAGAAVTVRSVETGATRAVLTNEAGRYSAGFLQPGLYTVTAEFPPLPAEERGPMRVSLGDQLVVDMALRPVEVEAIAVTVNPENQVDVSEGGVVELIDEEQIENLPTLGRDFT
ncbi:MAG: carboxypeptidase-like regulatory domain-containing protein, partial [Gemmatimonadota bacterium]